eukprot:CAMPEP_0202056596 /NCGR_PEP_ID=MMETSP0963-20130614/24824_1 /ASSEMBLY_ACC=CAM_ASM_000494 /TAXON_ID=4773 /ORGANISM="Schizochytrium aggregatum, Strain ATCC28209" /LENGTH=31 /DNA_ID= /DNA_START= /DNA_END= /DNA_ORIENTATION=
MTGCLDPTAQPRHSGASADITSSRVRTFGLF